MPDTPRPELLIKTTPAFKLKDKKGKNFQTIGLLRQFGFVPEVIVIEKVPGENNKLWVRAMAKKEAA